ncbi:NUDIX hydrolase [Polyangium mundeleinium]|uniref:GDP-mannose pyrophosphatase n=1 Tax=Polyangium mundeleinium TaxID=2995306 RepID=A0ABT5EIT8_9BACT|nr:NUDIX hydrolase [Polyangium mundeleinium]MDC0741724.1 NUDIX hydrolase [Polyangium mundeleinium]
MKPWSVMQSRPIVARRWLTVHEQRIALPHGGEIDEFHVIEAPDWASVLAVTEEGQVVFVDQYRHGAARVSRELPAGVIDAGETPEQAARRELEEETGFVAATWLPLLTTNTEPSRHTNRAHFFFAAGARRASEQRMDPAENIHVALMEPKEIVPAIERGQIIHGVHVGAILLAVRRGLLSLD